MNAKVVSNTVTCAVAIVEAHLPQSPTTQHLHAYTCWYTRATQTQIHQLKQWRWVEKQGSLVVKLGKVSVRNWWKCSFKHELVFHILTSCPWGKYSSRYLNVSHEHSSEGFLWSNISGEWQSLLPLYLLQYTTQYYLYISNLGHIKWVILFSLTRSWIKCHLIL